MGPGLQDTFSFHRKSQVASKTTRSRNTTPPVEGHGPGLCPREEQHTVANLTFQVLADEGGHTAAHALYAEVSGLQRTTVTAGFAYRYVARG